MEAVKRNKVGILVGKIQQAKLIYELTGHSRRENQRAECNLNKNTKRQDREKDGYMQITVRNTEEEQKEYN